MKTIFHLSPVKSRRFLGLFLYVLVTSLLVFIIRPAYFYALLIVIVPPALINFYWLKNARARVFWFSILTLVLFAPPVELMARLMNVWEVQSIFPRLFEIVPLENLLFAFLNFFWVLSFYEYFIDKDKIIKVHKKIKYLVLLYVVFAATVFGLYFYEKSLVAANYITIAVLTLIVPALLIFSYNLKLLKKTILPTLFFAIILFIYELVSLKIGSWFWPGDYLATFKIWGETWPLDDIIIWFFLSTPALIGGYEFFMDDYR
jgi:hypothetical protein